MLSTRIITFLIFASACCEAFVSPSQSQAATFRTTSSIISRLKAHNQKQQQTQQRIESKVASSIVAASILLSSVSPLPVQAYSDSDYASETVQEVISTLKNNAGNVDGTFKAYETVAEIITEGKGVGGMVNYSK